jgi:diamine N-acetyltransferase
MIVLKLSMAPPDGGGKALSGVPKTPLDQVTGVSNRDTPTIVGPPGGLLAGTKVCLRGLDADDLDFLYRWENDPAVWPFGNCGAEKTTDERFSRDELCQFIENQQHDIYVTGQMRFVICRRAQTQAPQGDREGATPVGFVDLFDFDPVERSAGTGILICDAADRKKGYAAEALRLAIGYAQEFLGLSELWCNIAPANTASLALFIAAGFVPMTARVV